MTKVILNIPHSSAFIPKMGSFLLSDSEIQQEIIRLTDWYTDDLFYAPGTIAVRADFSRIFCDVERFSDDDKEVMAKYGMGFLYTHTDDGRELREVDQNLRNEILEVYYSPFHQNLNETVKEQLLLEGNAIIVDCHSFPDIPMKRDLNQDQPRPDFNIGTDQYHTPKMIIEKAIKYFNNQGYSVGINWPYVGTIVPKEYYKTNLKVHSIMLEVNRRLYLENDTNRKNTNYDFCKKVVQGFIEVIR